MSPSLRFDRGWVSAGFQDFHLKLSGRRLAGFEAISTKFQPTGALLEFNQSIESGVNLAKVLTQPINCNSEQAPVMLQIISMQ